MKRYDLDKVLCLMRRSRLTDGRGSFHVSRPNITVTEEAQVDSKYPAGG